MISNFSEQGEIAWHTDKNQSQPPDNGDLQRRNGIF